MFDEQELLTDEQFFGALGTVVDRGQLPSAVVTPTRRTVLMSITEPLTQRPRRSVMAVGERGVGKSMLTGEALRHLKGDLLVFRAGAADALAGQMLIGMMEGRVQQIAERMRGKQMIWLFPAFEEALWAGQHLQSPRGLLDALLPHLESGAITVVAEIDDHAFEQLVRRRPKVLEVFEIVRVPPMPSDEVLEVARQWSTEEGVGVSDHLLREALDFADHYLPGLAAPGNVIRLLRAVARSAGEDRKLTPDALTVALNEMTGLPLDVLDPRAPLSLAELRTTLGSRVLGQPEAVECLVERVALIKAGLTDPSRPFGVFLFAGPTGTGKTELAKALAEYLFGSPDRLVRLDMSEFQTPESFERLIAERTRDEAPSAGFVSAIRSRPFSVVLLDEFEKAHASIWDLFLQVFDDGRLTTQEGQTVDFRHTIIILTSNIGSSLRTGQRVGFGAEREDFAAAPVERAIGQAFRPELINRIDRIVVFRPLDRELMRSLLEKELATMLQRRGFRMHPWAVEWDEAAIDLLIEKGFSSELGARPLKRAVERDLLAPLAMAIVERQFPEGEQFLFIGAQNGSRISVRFVDPDADTPGPPAARDFAELTLRAIALDPHRSLEEISFLEAEFERIDVRVRHWIDVKDEALEATRDPDFWESDERHALLARVEYLDRLSAAARTAKRLIERLRATTRAVRPAAADLVQLAASRLYVLDRALAELDEGDPNDAFLSIAPSPSTSDSTADAAAFAQRLARMYVAWAERRGMRIEQPHDGSGLTYDVHGLAAHAILAREDGLHVLETPAGESGFERVMVRVSVKPISITAPRPRDDEASDAPTAMTREIVRRYRMEPSPLVRDREGWRTGRADRVLGGDFDLFT